MSFAVSILFVLTGIAVACLLLAFAAVLGDQKWAHRREMRREVTPDRLGPNPRPLDFDEFGRPL
jgi:hypothetical protein